MIRMHRIAACALALVLAATTAPAQTAYPPPPPPPPMGAPPAAPAALYAPPQLDQMLAAVALYPDPLLTQILTAATYPYEVDAAARWLQVPANAALTDGPLGSVLAGIDWDPSVKSLVPFPQILRMMDAHLDWTQALGNAFLAQQPDVMDSIQRLRHEALAAGTLVSSPYETVTVDGPYIEIESAQPQSVFVPIYDPTAVYGAWPYPAYPPFYYGPPPGLRANYVAGRLGFSIGIGIVDLFWDWGNWDWRDHDVRVDRDRFNRINAGRPPIAGATWQHDPDHRRGVPYRDARSRASFQPQVPGSPEQRQQFRFYGAQQPASAPPVRTQERAAPQATPQRTAPAPQAQAQHAQTPRQPAPASAARAPAARPAQPSAAASRPATAFQGVAPGPQAQAEARRGQESRQAAAAPAARSAAPAARPAAPHPAAPAARPAPQAAPQHAAPQGNPRSGNPPQGEHRP